MLSNHLAQKLQSYRNSLWAGCSLLYQERFDPWSLATCKSRISLEYHPHLPSISLPISITSWVYHTKTQNAESATHLVGWSFKDLVESRCKSFARVPKNLWSQRRNMDGHQDFRASSVWSRCMDSGRLCLPRLKFKVVVRHDWDGIGRPLSSGFWAENEEQHPSRTADLSKLKLDDRMTVFIFLNMSGRMNTGS